MALMTMTLKKIVGNYIQVVDALGLPKEFYGPQSKEKYQKDVSKDIPRTRLYIPNGNLEDYKKALNDTRGIDSPYTQGNFDGGVFSEQGFSLSKLCSDFPSEYQNEKSNLKKTLRFSYLDDNNVPCAFAMTMVKGIGEHKYKCFFNIALINNVNASPKDRDVIWLFSLLCWLKGKHLIPLQIQK